MRATGAWSHQKSCMELIYDVSGTFGAIRRVPDRKNRRGGSTSTLDSCAVEQKTSVEQKCMGFRRTKIGQQCRQKRVFYDRDSNMYRYLSENILLTKL